MKKSSVINTDNHITRSFILTIILLIVMTSLICKKVKTPFEPSSIQATVTPTSINFGAVTVGQSSEQSFTISNSSNSNATLKGSVSIGGSSRSIVSTSNADLKNSVSISESPRSVGSTSNADLKGSVDISESIFLIVSGGGSYSLTPGQSKTVTVRFSAISETSYSGTVSITHNATNHGSPMTVSLSGTGQTETVIDISVSRTSINFGTVTVDQSSDQSFTINNSASSTAGLEGSVSISGSAFLIVQGEGSYSLTPGQSETVTVRFSPISEANYSDTVSITHNATNQGSPMTVSLSGTGQTETVIDISVSRTSINFGTVTVDQSSDQSFTINNSASSTAGLEGSVSISGSAFLIVQGEGSYSLTPGQSETVTVRFSPISEANYSDTVSITHNATNQGSPMTVSLSGTGQTETVIDISVSRTSINFGTVTVDQSSDQSFTIRNSSSSNATLTGSVTHISGLRFAIVSGGGSFNLSPGQPRTVVVRFSPLYATSYSGTVAITHNATNQGNPTTVSLSGTGQAKTVIISVSRNLIIFETVTVGQSSEQSFTIRNSSSSNADLEGSVSINGSAFLIVSGGGSFNLSPGQLRTVVVRFSPSYATSYSGTVAITHNATNQSSPTIISVSGSSQEAVIISVSPIPIWFETVTVGQSSEQSFTIRNSSSSTATLKGNVTIVGSAYSIVSGGGSFNLSPGQPRTVVVRFSPISVTNYAGLVVITHNATNSITPIQVSLSGIGGAPSETTLKVIFQQIHVINDGDLVGNGELYWTFPLLNVSNGPIYMLSERTRDNPFSVASDNTYNIGASYSFTKTNISGSYFGISFEFWEADVLQDDYVGAYSLLYYYDATTRVWPTKSYSCELVGTGAHIIVYWRVERID